jgi:hypothetical protein
LLREVLECEVMSPSERGLMGGRAVETATETGAETRPARTGLEAGAEMDGKPRESGKMYW